MLLSSWISNTEKTVITAAEISHETAERVHEKNAGALPKGYQQITGWEVQFYPRTCCRNAVLSMHLTFA